MPFQLNEFFIFIIRNIRSALTTKSQQQQYFDHKEIEAMQGKTPIHVVSKKKERANDENEDEKEVEKFPVYTMRKFYREELRK
mgnify:FL=1